MDRLRVFLESNFIRELFEILLIDRTTQKNIFWATSDYSKTKGEGFGFFDFITIEKIESDSTIRPRFLKAFDDKINRSRNMAEVFTPAWVCNMQNNLIDNKWFNRKNVFNIENDNGNGIYTWKTNRKKIKFPENKTWKDYVSEPRLEITCGEAPYLSSRYDTITGNYIEVPDRIGLLDRKLRVVSENTEKENDWYQATLIAYKSIYGFEWQGDNLLLARQSLLQTFIDVYKYKFPNKTPKIDQLKEIAVVISWNIWQMDGLKGVVPESCYEEDVLETGILFDHQSFKVNNSSQCAGCKTDNLHLHNGQKCIIMDWERNKPIKFVSLIK